MRQVVIASLLLSASGAEAADLKFPISTYGTPGLIDMPTGEVFPDGQLSATTSYFNDAQKYTLSFQISPRMFGSFRYSILDKFDAGSRNRYDRSFDFGYLLMEESNLRPSVVVGLAGRAFTGQSMSQQPSTSWMTVLH